MADIFSNLFGGLGLLLIGMSLMTDGLKLASGNALRDMLALWTNSRMRGLFSGFMITGIVQSSGVVTIATIGFVNAGMLTLQRAVWVVYGSNVGTTMTAWIVALIGFQLDIDALALPLTGLGALLKFTGSRTWRSSAGTALVGFGLLFLGISFLKDAFDNLGSEYSLPVLSGGEWFLPVVYVAIGLVLTSIMQSSTAAIVLTLGAAQGALIPLGAAGAVVIGANLGTTTTALLAVIGATATAKRVAVSHVAFNVVAAVFAILILGPMLNLVELLEMNLGLMPSAALTLAIFHTLFNIIGVLLMWPLTAPLVRLLDKRFSSTVELAAKPKHLDKTVLALPFIAADAIALEVARVNHHTIKAFRASLRYRQDVPHSFDEHMVVRKLANAIGAYSVELSSRELTPFLSETLANLIESTQQYLLVVDILEDLAELSQSPREHFHHEVATALDDYIDCISRHLDAQNLAAPECCIRGSASYDAVELYYRKLKDAILRSAARGELTMERMDGLLQYINQAKRASRQTLKATQRLLTVRDTLQRDANGLVLAHGREAGGEVATEEDNRVPETTAGGVADASVASAQRKQVETSE